MQCSSSSCEMSSLSEDVSEDEGESQWDALGRWASGGWCVLHMIQYLLCCRMSSVRRSSIFDRLQLKTVTLTRSHSGYGLELQGGSPPVIAHVCEFSIDYRYVCAYPNIMSHLHYQSCLIQSNVYSWSGSQETTHS